ncbi:hypothetical protein HMPREF9996_00613 [Aggregatibacter actinomycetemcomitans Y4]|nr:hypothetical protein HMPREF9996_00613 [Aggregatibacter actinomycetemcomitans Y4]
MMCAEFNLRKPKMTELTRLDPDKAIDIAYDIFLEMAPENLDPADIMLFNLQFEEHGAVEFVETADNWEEQIGILIDPQEYAEVWIGLVNKQDEMDNIFAKFLISHREEDRQYHIIWKA